MRAFKYTLVLFTLLAASGQTQDFPQRELFDSALAQYGLTVDDVRIDQDVVATYGGDRWRLSTFDLLYKNPFRIPAYTEALAEYLEENASNLSALLARGSQLIDVPVNREGVGLAQYTNFPDSLPVPSITRSKNFMRKEQFDPLRAKIDLLFQVIDSEDFIFKRGLKRVSNKGRREKLFDFFVKGNSEHLDLVYETVERIDFERTFAGAQSIARVIDAMVSAADSLEFPPETRQFKTGEGLVIVGGTGDDVHELFEPPLLILEGGGNDTYKFSGYANDYPLTIIIDYAGDDQYISTDSTLPGIGGAVLGMSVVVDLQGDDRYEGVNVCQGSGLFGIGMLYDKVGNDVYTASNYAQGAAAFGVGILSEGTGDDSLTSSFNSQGAGLTKGFGLYLGQEGNDVYMQGNVVNDCDLWPMFGGGIQGVGVGPLRLSQTGHQWAGGIGIAVDHDGNDKRLTDRNSCGYGHHYGTGIICDLGGNDSYGDIGYGVGWSSESGVGVLIDADGNDEYARRTGWAASFGIAYFADFGGDDVYGGVSGFGSGHGLAVFHDLSGDDTYFGENADRLGLSVAQPTSNNEWLNLPYCRTFGIFVDGGGNDKIEHKVFREGDWTESVIDSSYNNHIWLNPSSQVHVVVDSNTVIPQESMFIGVGIDAEYDQIMMPNDSVHASPPATPPKE